MFMRWPFADVLQKSCPLEISKNLQVSFNFLRKETPAQVFPCEFCEIFKSNFFIDLIRNYEDSKTCCER